MEGILFTRRAAYRARRRLLPWLAPAVVFSMVAAFPVLAAAQPAEVQEIAPWERAAVELALAYLDEGPSAWWDDLASGSWLTELGADGAAAEIAVRAGPARGASWELQTVLASEPAPPLAVFAIRFDSGVDEVLVLEMVEEAGAWRLLDLRGWAEATGEPLGAVALASSSSAETAKPVPNPDGEPVRERWVLSPAQRVFGPLIGLVLLIVASSIRRRNRLLAWLLLVLGLASLVLSLVLPGPVPWDMVVPPPGSQDSGSGGGGSGEEAVIPPNHPRSLAAVAPLRESVFQGEQDELAPGESVPARQTATLWQARQRWLDGDLPGAAERLATLPSPCPQPLCEVLRGRLGAARGEATEVVLGYDRALSALPAFDGLMLEAATAMAQSGFDHRAEELYQRLAAGGSRLARVHDALVGRAAAVRDEELAIEHLRLAWRLQPSERAAWLGDPVRSYLVRRHDLFDLLDLASPREPAPRAPTGSRPLAVPASFQATYTGEVLRAARGESELAIPGGLDLVPAAAVPEDAGTRRERQEARALTELSFARWPQSTAALLAPERAKAETAALALARAHRWDEILSVTDPLVARASRRAMELPPALGQLRAEALRRAGRREEATQLLVEVAKSNVALGRKDPGALFQLSGLLTEAEQWELAVRAAQTAEAQLIEPPMVSRVPRIRMERRLAQAYETHGSRNFEVRYPRGTNTYFVEQLTEVLEKEASRLRRWIPAAPGGQGQAEPIEVHLFPFREFFRLYSQGGEILGLFDGKVRVPLAELPSLHPSVVAVLTHEVAHALIAEATEDRAPAWLHEGLAQHVQMLQNQINPIPDYRRQGKLVAFPLLDAVLDGRSDPQLTELAYDEALWTIHYFEARYGRGGIHRLLDAFRRGRSTEQAIAEVTGRTVPEFDADLWSWAMNRTTWETEVVRYDR